MDEGVEAVVSPTIDEDGVIDNASQEVESAEAVSPDGPNDAVSTLKKESEGRLKELRSEREKRQRAEQQLRLAEQEIARQRYIEQQRSQAPQDPAYDPEDYPNVGTVQNLVRGELASVREELRQQTIQSQFDMAKKTYDDFDEVYALSVEMANDPDNAPMVEAILKSKNPAVAAYKWGKSHDGYVAKKLEKAKEETTTKVAEKISRNVNAPKTLANVGANNPSGDYQPGAFANMDDKAFKEYSDNVVRGNF